MLKIHNPEFKLKLNISIDKMQKIELKTQFKIDFPRRMNIVRFNPIPNWGGCIYAPPAVI